MGKLPVISGNEAVKAFARVGWRPVRRHGSHVVMEKPGREELLSVPLHRELKRGLLRGLIRDARMTVDEFVAML